ncbi:hypothetical protein [Anaerocolumna xylanovorans]|uniref:Uncharacterized protein n=1 Tax=Anaerocolumna xylanovorans DSM 12503 TaxID=1121345 RepID=A0A1M7YLG8_9FIRM|nr:hypothetical protein [Anaerocolumna xylanovorans]SHO53438.1 hypothetical protein SAMN02745217_04123 [Anaerocolumna xylanovorans DSM 12503]
MEERNMFAVIVDKISTELTWFTLSKKLTELDEESIKEIVEMLADNNPAWKDVLYNKRIAMIFEAESGDKMTINRNSSKFIINP